MKAINLILSIVIFLLAVASAAVSFILYGKRAQQADGWEKISTAIHQSAVQLDRINGTADAKKVAPEEFAFEKIGELDQKLDSYKGQVSKTVKAHNTLVAQRDGFADNFSDIAAKVGKEIPAADFKGEKSSDNAREVSDAVANLESSIQRQPGFRSVKLTDTPKKIAEVSKNLTSTKNALRNETNRANANEKKIKSAEARAKRASEALAKTQKETQKRIAAAKTAAESAAKKRIAAAEAKIKVADRKAAEARDELQRYKNQIGVPAKFTAWKDGSKEARNNISAQVIRVVNDYGYVVVNIGTESRVYQSTGGVDKNNPAKTLTVAVKPLIKKGFRFNVYRKTLTGDSELITAITLDQVGRTEATANIPADAEIKVGDYLMFVSEK